MKKNVAQVSTACYSELRNAELPGAADISASTAIRIVTRAMDVCGLLLYEATKLLHARYRSDAFADFAFGFTEKRSLAPGVQSS